MRFKLSRKRGKLWEDVNTIFKEICNTNLNSTSKSEKEFERHLTGFLSGIKNLNYKFSQQTYNDQIVEAAKFFGKNHRPDMSLNKDGLAIELKYINSSLDGAKAAIGQSYVYRTHYKYVVLILIVDKKHQDLYEREYIDNKQKSDRDNMFWMLAEDNIFTIIKPNFKPKKGLGNSIEYFLE